MTLAEGNRRGMHFLTPEMEPLHAFDHVSNSVPIDLF
jgi:hypothetical protein